MENNSKINEILKIVVRRETPSETRCREILNLADNIKRKVEREAATQRIETEIRIEGSVAKDTWLQNDVDIDIFMLTPENIDRKTLETAYMKVAKRSLRKLGLKPIEKFAEHPYVEAFANGNIRLNIVPCYKVTPPRWKSATDRTPYHTKFIKSHLKQEQKSEARILKRFLKGIEAYGADIKTGGFSGYLTELLILRYGSFTNTVKNASKWKIREIIDIEGHYNEKREDVKKLFDSPLVFIDPIDQHRNVAAAVTVKKFDVFRAASKFFLEKPSLTFFYPKKTAPYSPKYLSKILSGKHADYLFLKINNIQSPPDILWGQLYRMEKSVRHLLEKFDFKVLRSTCWSDEMKYCILTFELEKGILSNVKKHYGPPVISNQERIFTTKYAKVNQTLSGPYIENGRWVVQIRRKYTDAVKLIAEGLKSGREKIGVPSRIYKATRGGYEILMNREISKFYMENSSFATFLTRFMKGKPSWFLT